MGKSKEYQIKVTKIFKYCQLIHNLGMLIFLFKKKKDGGKRKIILTYKQSSRTHKLQSASEYKNLVRLTAIIVSSS